MWNWQQEALASTWMQTKQSMCFNQKGEISTLNRASLKLVDKFTYLCSSISSTESDVSMRLVKAWTVIDRLSIIWKSDLSDKIKQNFFQAAVVSVLLYGCTTLMLSKNIEKKLDRNCTRMLWAIMNNSWKQHPMKQQLYNHLPPISKNIQIRQTRHGTLLDELISDVLIRTPSHGRGSVRWPTRTYLQQLCCLEDLPRALDNRDEWWERDWEIRASSVILW